jgi:hypothetical protein
MDEYVKVLMWEFHEIAEQVEDILKGAIEEVKPVLETEGYYYMEGKGTRTSVHFEVGEQVLLRVTKLGEKDDYAIHGRLADDEDRNWIFLNYI